MREELIFTQEQDLETSRGEKFIKDCGYYHLVKVPSDLIFPRDHERKTEQEEEHDIGFAQDNFSEMRKRELIFDDEHVTCIEADKNDYSKMCSPLKDKNAFLDGDFNKIDNRDNFNQCEDSKILEKAIYCDDFTLETSYTTMGTMGVKTTSTIAPELSRASDTLAASNINQCPKAEIFSIKKCSKKKERGRYKSLKPDEKKEIKSWIEKRILRKNSKGVLRLSKSKVKRVIDQACFKFDVPKKSAIRWFNGIGVDKKESGRRKKEEIYQSLLEYCKSILVYYRCFSKERLRNYAIRRFSSKDFDFKCSDYFLDQRFFPWVSPSGIKIFKQSQQQ